MEMANKKYKEILASYEAPVLPPSMEKDLKRFIDSI